MAKRVPSEGLMTLEEYERLPSDDGWKDELSRGRLVREPGPGHEHGRVQVNLATFLNRFVREHALGYIVAESGFVLERHPDTVRGPDVAFVSRERYGDMPPRQWAEFAPDLAVEVLSPSDRPSRMAEKVAQYFGAGTRLVWLIDPEDRTAVVYRTLADIRLLTEDEDLDGGDVLPGFSCRLAELFD
jgi:Uma2 family endonuclease